MSRPTQFSGPALCVLLLMAGSTSEAQTFPSDDPVIRRIWAEGMDSSRVYPLSQVLLDSIGPRLTGSPSHRAGNDWLLATYRRFGIDARNEPYGTWRGWRRGHTHVDLIAPRVRTLEATLLAWSPGTRGRVEGPAILLPDVADSAAFAAWLPRARGAFVLTSLAEPTCRPDESWREHAAPAVFERMLRERTEAAQAWARRTMRTGLTTAALQQRLADAGARGIVTSRWSNGWGVNKIFSTRVSGAPVIDLSCEDYGLVFRLAERNQGPVLRVDADAQPLGEVPVFNTIAEIRGSERAGEYVILSAHFDSWDGASGATDNGTGTIIMLEAMRILRRVYPNPKRTILAAHWGGEEQGLNGSRAFAEDHPEIVQGLHALFNHDEGTGRITSISMEGFAEAGGYFARWLSRIPGELSGTVTLNVPGMPGAGTDHAAFVCHGAPAFSPGPRAWVRDWDYGAYTWHTNRDTFDKIAFDNVRDNATLIAMLAYLAAEDPELMPRDRRILQVDPRTGEPRAWPSCAQPARSSRESSR